MHAAHRAVTVAAPAFANDESVLTEYAPNAQSQQEQIEELHGRLRRAADRRDRVRCEHNRLLALYASQADRLKKLTEIVLGHHNKDDSNFSLQASGETLNTH